VAETVRIRYLGGPTAQLELGGVRLLTDPTFDPPGDYRVGERVLRKTTGPALPPEELGQVDAVLLSHHQHPDNLDRRGTEFLSSAPITFSTEAAADHLGGCVRGLGDWESAKLRGKDGLTVDIVAVPALHGPEGSEPLVGRVTGFMLEGPGLPRVYISGDNASLDRVREIVNRSGPIDLALLFVGAAQTALVAPAFLTLTSDDAVEATRILGEPDVVPLHFEGWAHYTEGADALRKAFARAGLEMRLHIPSAGEWMDFAGREA
jgi:L-ascorbate metabolism protein UlaG (beta-lactamase superfamily)